MKPKKTKLDEIDRQIIRYKREGFSNSIISYTLGLTKPQLAYRIKTMKERFGIHFYEEDLDQFDKIIIDLKSKGYGTNIIASALNISPSSVNKRVNRIKEITGMTFPPKKRFLDELDEQIYEDLQNGLSGREIAEKHGISESKASRRKQKIEEVMRIEIPLQRIDEIDELIIQLQKDENLKSDKIAEKVGLSGQAVRQRIKKIEKIEKKQLATMIMKLIYSRNATIEQILALGREYGLEEKDFDEIMNTLDER